MPLTVFRLEHSHRAAVIELGMNHVGEIAALTAIAQPTIGLVNNAQREHQEFMQSVEAVARENGTVIQTLPPEGVAVFPAGDTYSALWSELAGDRAVVTFGFDGSADVSARVVVTGDKTRVAMQLGGETAEVKLATSGRHNVMNAMAAAACCLAAGIDRSAIVRGLETFVPVHGRLERKTAFNGAQLIDDTYNANPDSVRAAIDVLADMSGDGVLVLGDMGEVGDNGIRFHAEKESPCHICRSCTELRSGIQNEKAMSHDMSGSVIRSSVVYDRTIFPECRYRRERWPHIPFHTLSLTLKHV